VFFHLRFKLILTFVSALITLLISVPLAGAGERITADNAGQVSRLARLGQGIVNRAVFSPNGNLVAVATSLGIRFYDFKTLAEVYFIETSSNVQYIAFSPDGSTVAAGLRDGTVCVYHVPEGSRLFTLEGHGGSITGVSFSPDGTILATGSAEGTVRLWRSSGGESLGTINMPYSTPVYGIAFSQDGAVLATGHRDGMIRFWRSCDGILLQTITNHDTAFLKLTFSADGAILASASDDGTVCLWGIMPQQAIEITE
jgi:WD40 repeat protein